MFPAQIMGMRTPVTVTVAPTVLGRNTGGTGGGAASNTHVVTFDTTPTAGQLLVVEFTYGNNGAATLSATAGWTLSAQMSNASSPTAYIATKTATGSDALTLTLSGGVTAVSAWVSRRISSGATYDGVSSAGGNSTNSNPASRTFAGGSGDYLILAGAAKNNSTVPTAAPTGYSNLQTASASTTLSIGSSEKSVSGVASEDPGTFTSTTGNWRAWTVALK